MRSSDIFYLHTSTRSHAHTHTRTHSFCRALDVMSELDEYRTQLQSVEVELRETPEDETLLALKEELTELIEMLEAEGDEAEGGALDEPPVQLQSQPQPQPQLETKNDKTSINHEQETKQKSSETLLSTPTPISGDKGLFKVGDQVLARWVSGDKQFYPAKVTAVTGSNANPMYMVKFPSKDGTVDTVRAEGVKRYNVPSSHAPQSRSGSETSRNKPSFSPSAAAAASNNPQQSSTNNSNVNGYNKGNKQPSKASILDESKNKWKQFQSRGSKSKRIGESSKVTKSSSANSSVLGMVGVPPSKPKRQRPYR